MFDRNLIIIAGPFASGKTHTANALKHWLDHHHIPYQREVISDAKYLLDALKYDDEYCGGVNHIHPDGTELGFVVTGYPIQQYMYSKFTDELSADSDPLRIRIAEWSGGANTHTPDSIARGVDYSFRKMTEEFAIGTYPLDWINNTLAIIHPYVPVYEDRLELNRRRGDRNPNHDEIMFGERSWMVPEFAMPNAGDDDFMLMQEFLERRGLDGRIHTILNDRQDSFIYDLEHVVGDIFRPWTDPELSSGHPDTIHFSSLRERDI